MTTLSPILFHLHDCILSIFMASQFLFQYSLLLLLPTLVVSFEVTRISTDHHLLLNVLSNNHHHHASATSMTRSSTALNCQLLGMNCATPTDFTFSFQGFCRRGGDTDIHSDGWGLAFYQGDGLRQFHDVEAASTSQLAEFLGNFPIRTLNMMGHIRYATVGNVNLANVHPFSREMWGIDWCFAHNGEVPMFDENPNRKLTALSADIRDKRCADELYYNPVGSTDSEATFCAILNALRQRFDMLPSLPVLYEAIQALCDEIVQEEPDLTILNFMLTCGPHALWVYSWPGSRPGSKVWNGLHYTTREHPFTVGHLRDIDYSLDFSTCTTKDDRVSVIATQPLTDDEQWTELSRGELILFDQGKPRITPRDLFQVELEGHGLNSTVLEKSVLEDDMRLYKLDPSTFTFEGFGI